MSDERLVILEMEHTIVVDRLATIDARLGLIDKRLEVLPRIEQRLDALEKRFDRFDRILTEIARHLGLEEPDD